MQGVGYKINPACFQGKATVVLTKRSCGSASEWVSRSLYWSPSRCATSPARNAGSGTRATTPPDEHFRHPRGRRGPSHRQRPASFSARPRREASRGRTTSPYNAETRWLMAPLYLDRADVQPTNEGIDLCPIFPLLPPSLSLSPIFFLRDFSLFPSSFFATYVRGGSLKYLNNVSREICLILKILKNFEEKFVCNVIHYFSFFLENLLRNDQINLQCELIWFESFSHDKRASLKFCSIVIFLKKEN